MRAALIFRLIAAAVVMTLSTAQAQMVLLEAEGFDNYGGWVLDQQFMDQMGSPFLLAHGITAPVEDASTRVTFPTVGMYRVWVRTRDWTAPWKEPHVSPSSVRYANGTPGRFQVMVNGVALGVTFGVEGNAWHWQDGGTVVISEIAATVALHDLTGFEGRCDAVLFSKDLTFNPPNQDPAMKAWRRGLLGLSETTEAAGDYDLVVIGGGMAGTCAAVSAARHGARVALIQDRPVLGGNNSSEVRVHLGGETNFEPYPRIGDIVKELDPGTSGNRGPAANFKDDKKLAVVEAEPNIDLYLNYRGNEVEVDGSTIVAVVAESTETGRRLRFTARTFADCTGDGSIGYLAGADWEMTVTDASATRMGRSNLWRFVNTGAAATFPSCPWALNLTTGNFPTSDLGNWFWESGFWHDPFEKSEYIRDWNFRAAYGAWDALKNKTAGYSSYVPEWQAYIYGMRESRRLLGDLILTRNDLMNAVAYEDGCVPTSWSIDLHYVRNDYGVNKGFGGDEFISTYTPTAYPRPYWVPYRCLYSRNIDNLFLAGRNISVTHEALGTVRVMRTTGMMGEIVGMAASLCKKYDTTPRRIYTDHLGELKKLMKQETPASGWLGRIGGSLALGATVTVSSNYDAGKYPSSNINDGRDDIINNNLRWLSSAGSMPDYVTFRLAKPVHISAARIVSGYYNGQSTVDSIIDFKFQCDNGGGWQDIGGAAVTNNGKVVWTGKFSPVKTQNVRLVITQTPGNISRIWEVAFFHPKADIDDDGVVGFGDVCEFASQWLEMDPWAPSDLDGSGGVDADDFGILASFWRWP
ncbi:MAG: FAD-dependent oxidoreductase [Phycisphaerae bacterium]|nr:FAD-dependent oxidoreductase [Phycisphaerae bacterium]